MKSPILTPSVAEPRTRLPEITYPSALPVSQRKDEIAAAIRDHQVVIGEPWRAEANVPQELSIAR